VRGKDKTTKRAVFWIYHPSFDQQAYYSLSAISVLSSSNTHPFSTLVVTNDVKINVSVVLVTWQQHSSGISTHATLAAHGIWVCTNSLAANSNSSSNNNYNIKDKDIIITSF